jgi:hypothetical protein
LLVKFGIAIAVLCKKRVDRILRRRVHHTTVVAAAIVGQETLGRRVGIVFAEWKFTRISLFDGTVIVVLVNLERFGLAANKKEETRGNYEVTVWAKERAAAALGCHFHMGEQKLIRIMYEDWSPWQKRRATKAVQQQKGQGKIKTHCYTTYRPLATPPAFSVNDSSTIVVLLLLCGSFWSLEASLTMSCDFSGVVVRRRVVIGRLTNNNVSRINSLGKSRRRLGLAGSSPVVQNTRVVVGGKKGIDCTNGKARQRDVRHTSQRAVTTSKETDRPGLDRFLSIMTREKKVVYETEIMTVVETFREVQRFIRWT